MSVPLDSFYSQNISRIEFAVYNVAYSENNRYIKRPVIVIREKETGFIIKFTDYADYVLYRIYEDQNVYKANIKNVYAISQFLNYALVDNYSKYHNSSVNNLNIDMFKDFLNDYAQTILPSGRYPSQQSVSDKRIAVSIFGEMLCHYKGQKMKNLKKGDFIQTILYQDEYRTVEKYRYKLKIRCYDDYTGELKQLYRDMPIELLDRFLQYAEMYEPELCFPICLQAYAGLREGEICNVRRKGSYYGPGIITTSKRTKDKYGNDIFIPTSFQIDLRHEYLMRKDYVYVGEIKSERIVSVWGPFVEKVNKYYLKHLRLIKEKSCDDDIQPMFLNKNKTRETGQYEAMTIDRYTSRIKRLFYEYILPSCENDANPDIALFFQQMKNHTWGLHAFRHWFTVFLLYCGVDDVARLKDLRGDRSDDSAKDYLKRKGVLMNIYTKSLDTMGLMIRGDK